MHENAYCLTVSGCTTLRPNQQCTLNKLLTELWCRNFVNKLRLSIQIGAQRAKNVRAMCTVHVHIPTELPFLRATVGGWVHLGAGARMCERKPPRVKEFPPVSSSGVRIDREILFTHTYLQCSIEVCAQSSFPIFLPTSLSTQPTSLGRGIPTEWKRPSPPPSHFALHACSRGGSGEQLTPPPLSPTYYVVEKKIIPHFERMRWWNLCPFVETAHLASSPSPPSLSPLLPSIAECVRLPFGALKMIYRSWVGKRKRERRKILPLFFFLLLGTKPKGYRVAIFSLVSLFLTFLSWAMF